MNIALRRPMSRLEFFAWAERQDGRYEFDGLRPVATGGGTLGHDQITSSIIEALRSRLHGTGGRAAGPNARLSTLGDTVRMRYMIVESSSVCLSVHARGRGSEPWSAAGLAAGDTLEIPELGIAIPTADLYRDTDLGRV